VIVNNATLSQIERFLAAPRFLRGMAAREFVLYVAPNIFPLLAVVFAPFFAIS
jgi:hypothetical protein